MPVSPVVPLSGPRSGASSGVAKQQVSDLSGREIAVIATVVQFTVLSTFTADCLILCSELRDLAIRPETGRTVLVKSPYSSDTCYEFAKGWFLPIAEDKWKPHPPEKGPRQAFSPNGEPNGAVRQFAKRSVGDSLLPTVQLRAFRTTLPLSLNMHTFLFENIYIISCLPVSCRVSRKPQGSGKL